MKRQSLGVVMIVKNEEGNLGRVLSDISGVVDEVIVVDTGSIDDTVKIAESFGVTIATFPWQNDFAAARNHSIECASCDYLLWLDADDHIDEHGQQAIRTLKTQLRSQKDTAYMLKIQSCSRDTPETVSYQTRIIPNREGVRFEGRVHEQILPSLERCGIAVLPTDISIWHTGYHDKESRDAKGRRNLKILLEEYHDGKDTATQCFFIAMASIAIEDHEQCLDYIDKAREKRTNEDWLLYSFVIATECLMKLGRIEDAYRESRQGLSIFNDSVLLHFFHGVSCLEARRFEEASLVLNEATKLPLQISTYPIPPDISGRIWFHYAKALEGLGRIQEAITCYNTALDAGYDPLATHHALGLVLIKAKQIQKAAICLEQAKKSTEGIDTALWMSLANVYSYTKRHADALNLFIEVFNEIPTDLHALTGILESSIRIDNTHSFFSALEQFITLLDISLPEEINTLAECALLCTEIGRHLAENRNDPLAGRLAGIALNLDPACSAALILLSDLAYGNNDIPVALTHLEKALKSGADPQEILSRITRMEQARTSA